MDFHNILGRQRAFFQSGATRPLDFRRDQLRKLMNGLETREGRLLDALHADLRKPAQEAYASELGFVLGELRHALKDLPRWMQPRRTRTPLLVWPSSGVIQPEPYGVSLIVGPWNYPLQLLLSPVVGALAAGNCAVLKPSEFAPHTAAAIEELVKSLFPEDYVTVVTGERDVAEALLRERFDVLFFTGSTAVGRAVMTAAARHLTPLTLELGGKCPCLVCADAPLKTTARRIAWGKFLNAGQTCVAPDFLLVHRSIRDDLIAALRESIHTFYGDDPQRSPDYSRVINSRHFDRLVGYIKQGTPVVGGGHDASDLYIAPTILTDISLDTPVMQEEIFGPLLPVLDFGSLDEAMEVLRDRPTPLAFYVFTRDPATQRNVLDQVRSGGACVNDTVSHMVGADMPFGGLGASGFGAYHGKATFDRFTHYRAVLRRSLRVDPPMRYPPPRTSLNTLKRAVRFLLR